MKIVGLMLASNNVERGRSYQDMVTACKETWIASRHPDVEIIATWGNTYQPYITNNMKEGEYILTQDNDLLIQTEEARENLAIKTIRGMECALDRYPDLDYVFRPNCGSYVHTYLLHDFLLDKPRRGYYAGVPLESRGVNYVSGACYILSRDLVELIVENQKYINLDGWKFMDDCSMGEFLTSQGVQVTDTKTRVCAESEEELVSKWDDKCYHYYFCHTINPKLIRKTHELFTGVTA